MTSTMLRRCLTAAVALAALVAVVALAPESSAEAGPEVSPFAGTYAWTYWPVAITISDGGRITSSYSFPGECGEEKGSINGRISADGSYSFRLSQSGCNCLDERCSRRTRDQWRSSYQLVGNMVPDADGNITGTPDIFGSVIWLRQ